MSRKKKKGAVSSGGQRPLDGEDVAALNRAFYASDPGDHLNLRLQHLLRLASQSDAELRREEQTHTFGKLELTIPSTSDDPADEDAHKRLVLIEAEMLLHQTAETLLRLFFAHAAKPAVPWIELDQLRGPGQFKRELKARIANSDKTARLRGDIGLVFFGRSEASPDLTDEAKTDREAGVGRLVEYLRYFAGILIERDAIYNAAKHGLAVQAGEPAIRVGKIAELSAGGPAISYLKKQKGQGGGREWVVATQWIDLEREFSFVYLGAWIIRALWFTARIRYVKWPPPEDGWSLPALSVKDVVEAARNAKETESMVESIALPPAVHTPRGSGTDLLIKELRGANGEADE